MLAVQSFGILQHPHPVMFTTDRCKAVDLVLFVLVAFWLLAAGFAFIICPFRCPIVSSAGVLLQVSSPGALLQVSLCHGLLSVVYPSSVRPLLTFHIFDISSRAISWIELKLSGSHCGNMEIQNC